MLKNQFQLLHYHERNHNIARLNMSLARTQSEDVYKRQIQFISFQASNQVNLGNLLAALLSKRA